MTLSPVAEAGEASASLFCADVRARQVSETLDRINRRFGHNALHFGSMQLAIGHDAAPLRIPFSVIPEPASEDEAATPAHAQAEALLLRRERHYRVLAQARHRRSGQAAIPASGAAVRE